MNRKKMIKEIAKTIRQYIKPVNNNLGCKHCIAGLSEMIYDIFEKKETKKKE